jgi:hypothetical protein
LLYERDVTVAGIVRYRGEPILELESPVCVRTGRQQQDDLGANVPRDNIRLIQLVLLPSIVGPLPDRRIAVTGTLFAADSDRHRTRVVLYVKAIDGAYESR